MNTSQPEAITYNAFISPRWRKVLRDLGHNKTRTIVVVLSIAVGVFAVGTIVSTQIMLSNDLEQAYMATHPASAILYPDSFDQALVEVVGNMEGIEAAEGRRSINLQIVTEQDKEIELNTTVFDDYENIQLNQIEPLSGAWPPPKREVLIERSYLANLDGFAEGDYIQVKTPDGKAHPMRIAGLVHDLNLPPAQFVSDIRGYITFETMEWLGISPGFDEMHILVDQNQSDKDYIQTVADSVEKKIEKSGRTNYWTWVPDPGKHPATDAVEPMLLILGVLGGISLFLSGFLVTNTISALLGQQIRQIGIMKSIGAQTGQIVVMYLVAVIILGVLSLFVAVPLGAFVAYKFTEYMAGLINFDLAGFRIPPLALGIEVAVGIIVPLLAASIPVFIGSRISAAEAMRDIGLGRGHFGANFIDRTFQWITSTIRIISQPVRISLRNTIRRKARLAMTLFTLTLGGAIFIAVQSVHASLLTTLEDALSYWNYHVEVDFSNAHRIDEIEREARKIPGVSAVESWIGNTARHLRPDGEEGPNFSIIGTPADTKLIQPTLLEGRWLLPADENALVVNTTLLDEETEIKVGDKIKLKIEGRESEWLVVGVVRGVMTGRIAYANYPYFARTIRFLGRSGGVQLVAEETTPTAQETLAKQAKAYFESLGMRVRATETTASIRENIETQFNVIVFFLAFMAVLIAVVGGLGLMGTMSMNVIERTREIGVMRAVGANNGAILKVVLVEGLFIGLISWVVGVLIALPVGKLMSDGVGLAFMDAPLSYTFSVQGALLWLSLVLVLSGLASFLPSWNASRLTIREVLAYE